ncbi:Clavaminate synthase-like protein [Polychaeton citri CBS 116435]|uniref:Clavaminate synthase-like protein n=1 Tax=Polychaeton citri CBS 116435 TaxID=1314669 RepID=A0A9P4UT94_9PEZI|nr:Clavaminate synthase-like protein [Polychaeton citri CBS 116435]
MRTGFAKLKNHGFSVQELQYLFTWSHKFFDQPVEKKNEIPNETGPRPVRGYTEYRIENIPLLHYDEKIRRMIDSKGHFDQGPTHDKEYPNKWPNAPELAGFRPFMEEFYSQCDDICLKLMNALEIAFGIEDGSLVERCVPSATDLRLTYHSPIPAEDMTFGRASRIAPHTDFGPITLPFQDGTGGLEIEDRTNPEPYHYVPLPPTDTTEMILNVGDTLTRWTNGRISGGIHRVTPPEALKYESGSVLPGKMSMAYLFKAERSVSVDPLSRFVSDAEPARYPEMTAFEFQKWRNSLVYV